jgi:hypothetical protein
MASLLITLSSNIRLNPRQMEKTCSCELALVVVLLVTASCESNYLSIATMMFFCLISYGYLLDFRSQVYHSSSFQELNPFRSFQFLVRRMKPATNYARINRGFVAKLLRKVSSAHIQTAFVFVIEIKELQESFIFERCNLVSLRMGT